MSHPLRTLRLLVPVAVVASVLVQGTPVGAQAEEAPPIAGVPAAEAVPAAVVEPVALLEWHDLLAARFAELQAELAERAPHGSVAAEPGERKRVPGGARNREALGVLPTPVLEEQVRSVFQALVDARTALIEANPGTRLGIGPAVFPVGGTYEFVNSWGQARSGGRRHKGTDILAPEGAPLYAIESGVIERYSESSLGGLSFYFLGDSGARYYYAHLSAYGPFAEGERVEVGAVVGYNGDTGNARGTPHLHFQYAPDGGEGWVNPYPLLMELRAAVLPGVPVPEILRSPAPEAATVP
jgi:murein DD-endopeptidase MepM/ murein hydrolase activator NlpD